jgi:tyrosinase
MSADSFGITRRTFLATTAAAAVATSLPIRLDAQQPSYTRVSLTDPKAPAMLDSYATAITKLLELPPDDPRNFYRNVFVHTLDCPHGNWWFLPWHRGYLGWWEQTVREMSGNPEFAFPYWDWTEQPYVPDAFWQGALNPSNFVIPFNDFKTVFTPAMNQFYGSLSAAQTNQLQQRPTGIGSETFASEQSFWDALPSMYFSAAQARSLTEQDPHFDPSTTYDVSPEVVLSALATPVFSTEDTGSGYKGGFGSGVTSQHSMSTTQGILEGLPHNNVHNDVGGFMGDFLSPVDPIFMAHHSNIDRLWTVWDTEQAGRGLPLRPTGDLKTQWDEEPFLFYIDRAGQPVSQDQAGYYSMIGGFDYTYTPGFPLDAPAAPESMSSGSEEVRRVKGTLQGGELRLGAAAVANVRLPGAAPEGGPEPGRNVHAHITVEPPVNAKGIRYHVFVNPPENARALDTDHPAYAGTFEFFGRMHHDHPVTFTVPVTEPVRALKASGAMPESQSSIRIHVVPQTRGIALEALPRTRVTNVEVSVF